MADLTPIFKAYDIRGRSPDDLDADAARRIGNAFARFSGAERIAVGRDCRLSSPEIAGAFGEGIRDAGIDVWDIGQITTDMVYYVAGAEEMPGAMITASHNPPDWNGIKLCLSGARPVGADTGLEEIRIAAEAGLEPADRRGERSEHDFRAAYIDHMLGIVHPEGLAPLRVAVDGGNGMAGMVVPQIFERIAPHLDGLYLDPDGTFPNHPADPIQPENLRDLIDRMEATGADLGVAFDGDADRAFFVDDRRRPLSGSTTTAIVAGWFLEREPGATVVHNLITSRAVPELVVRLGGTPVRTRVGHSFIKQVMAETGAVFGGEHSGHYYFRDNFRADSGILAMLILLRVLSEAEQPLSELRRAYEPYVQSGEVNLTVDDQQAVMRNAAEAFGDAEAEWMDGVTVSWPDRWFNLRPSNTEPLLRLNVEAQDQATVDDIVARVSQLAGAT